MLLIRRTLMVLHVLILLLLILLLLHHLLLLHLIAEFLLLGQNVFTLQEPFWVTLDLTFRRLQSRVSQIGIVFARAQLLPV